MGTFNAVVAVPAGATQISANLALELERLLTPWKEGRFDWYAIGVTSWRFAMTLKTGFRYPTSRLVMPWCLSGVTADVSPTYRRTFT